jgi:hypothetical protein
VASSPRKTRNSPFVVNLAESFLLTEAIETEMPATRNLVYRFITRRIMGG